MVYIGHNTKIMKNSPCARTKTSRIYNLMNSQIILIFGLQLILSLIGASLFVVLEINNNKDLKYLYNESHRSKIGIFDFFSKFGTWILIFTNLVPISLLVTLEMIKFIQVINHIYKNNKVPYSI